MLFMTQRVVNGVRVLHVEQIQKLSPHGFRAYRKKVFLCQWLQHHKMKINTPTEEDRRNIRALDGLARIVTKEHILRKEKAVIQYLSEMGECLKKKPKKLRHTRRSVRGNR
jgi:hypothetical protein